MSAISSHVAPYTGAWIEIKSIPTDFATGPSHPTRVRGLKFIFVTVAPIDRLVAPYTGAWIEIVFLQPFDSFTKVAPYTGAWIEIIVISPDGMPK